MNKRIIFWQILGLIFISGGCLGALGKPESLTPLEMDHVNMEVVQPLVGNLSPGTPKVVDPEAPVEEAQFSLSVEEPKAPGALQDLVRKHLFEGKSPTQWGKEKKEAFFKAYLTEVPPVLKEFPDARSMGQWSEGYGVKLSQITREYLVFESNREWYHGGAHGMHSTDFVVLDRMGLLKVELTDLIKDADRGPFMELLEHLLRTQMEIPPEEPLSEHLLVETLPWPVDFYLAPKGIGVQWDPYEIAAYYLGGIEIVLPWGEVDSFLTPLGKKFKPIVK